MPIRAPERGVEASQRTDDLDLIPNLDAQVLGKRDADHRAGKLDAVFALWFLELALRDELCFSRVVGQGAELPLGQRPGRLFQGGHTRWRTSGSSLIGCVRHGFTLRLTGVGLPVGLHKGLVLECLLAFLGQTPQVSVQFAIGAGPELAVQVFGACRRPGAGQPQAFQ